MRSYETLSSGPEMERILLLEIISAYLWQQHTSDRNADCQLHSVTVPQAEILLYCALNFEYTAEVPANRFLSHHGMGQLTSLARRFIDKK